MGTADIIFGKICLNATRDTFFQYVDCNQEKDNHFFFFFWGGGREGRVTCNRMGKFKILGMRVATPSSLVGKLDPPHKELHKECAYSAYCNNFKRLRKGIFFQSNTFPAYIDQNLWWFAIYARLSVHFRVEVFKDLVKLPKNI